MTYIWPSLSETCLRPEKRAFLWPSPAQSMRSEPFGVARAACFEDLAGHCQLRCPALRIDLGEQNCEQELHRRLQMSGLNLLSNWRYSLRTTDFERVKQGAIAGIYELRRRQIKHCGRLDTKGPPAVLDCCRPMSCPSFGLRAASEPCLPLPTSAALGTLYDA